ncbi:hypothetical protein AT00_17290 [Pseudoalteromonas lipolytica SCSIO 04301]|uniref:hypothetical protein n=1 Tax=Pseudoalteromonas lipolytica TaxID=570156 RepID=UPI0004460224|nr:hypothetical protein [Pseudoalteromonas lipolytica]EWH04901.1 hypothetical protein AT00_17290 [Pseudoalteromonas lipolytica SCSIO 04301]
MKRISKIALIPAAITAVLAGNAYAGTEACFEVYKGADALAVSAFDTIYEGASCGARTGASNTTLAAIDETSIAYELTGNLSIDFDAIDGVDTDQHIVYIPTTDIPGGTKLKVTLTGAMFDGNSNQIHLVKDADGSGANTNFEAVASSDGAVDGQSTITFLTKAGITIGAGTRLAFSRISTGADSTAIDPVGIKISNTDCTTDSTSKSVTIAAIEAITDGGNGYNIIGAVAKAQKIADISSQFYSFNGGTTAAVDVNAESSNSENQAIVARTEFVYDADATKRLVATKTQAIYKTAFYNRGATLDRKITLTANDHLETQFVADSEPGSTVKMGIYNSRQASDGTLADQVNVQTGTTFGSFGLTKAAAPVYNTEALDVFTPATSLDAESNPAAATSNLNGAAYNELYYAVTNTSTSGVMNFNYNVNTFYTLDFGTTAYIDHCEASKNTHDIGVNGAVLKVPYVVNADGNFVRITNEHDESAEITVDVFGESADGNDGTRKVTAVKLGTVAAKSSVVYFVPKLIEEAVSQKSYEGADGGYAESALGSNAASNERRHTLTFTVTAPRDLVHGVSVQRVLGGSDRVMPVLDKNEWNQ